MARNPSMTMRFMATPTDLLYSEIHGVHGGRVLQWIDKAAYACATAWSSSYCVTAYFGHIHFTRPIPSGHLVEVRSRIAYTGRSSMHIVNEVLSADPRDGVYTRACDCLVIFVAMDENGKPTPVPTFEPSNEDEERLKQAALSRVELRKDIEKEMDRQTYSDAGTAPRLQTRFLAKPTDVNWGGNVHGGTAMEWVDEAATACSMNWVRRPTVAVYAGGIRFYRPIHIGDLVEVEARLLHTGVRAMHMSVHVRSGDPRVGREGMQLALHSSMSFVALDDAGEALSVPAFRPVTDEDKSLWQHVEILRELRAKYAPLPLVDEEEPFR